jgi:hypothetical protein
MAWYPVGIFPDDPSYAGATSILAVAPTWFGYVAVGYGPAGGRTWWSSDGGSWTEARYPEPSLRLAQLQAVAASPDVIVAGGTIRDPSDTRPGLWSSRDGVAWTAADLGADGTSGSIAGVTWTGTEFVAVGRGAANDGSPEAWRSSDGRTWTAQDLGDADPVGIVSGPAGTVAWGRPLNGPSTTRGWTIGPNGGAPVAFSIGHAFMNMVATPAGFVALEPVNPSGYTVLASPDGRAWHAAGTLAIGGPVVLGARPDGNLIVASTAPDQAIEVDESSDGAHWSRATWPSAPERLASMAALTATDLEVIGVGSTGTSRVGAWLGQPIGADVPVGLERDPVFVGCPTAATRADPFGLLVDLFRLPSTKRASCIGSATIHVRGYLAAPDGVGGTCGPQVATPAWLTGGCPSYPAGWLESVAVPFGSATILNVFAHAPLASAFSQGHWVDVAGHFNDPAATSCRLTDSTTGQLDEPAEQTIATCNGHFVATAITLIKTPVLPRVNADPAAFLAGLPADYVLAPATSGWDNLALPAGTTWGFRDVTGPAGLRVLVTSFLAPTQADAPAIVATLRQSHGPTTPETIAGVAVYFSDGDEGAVFAIGDQVFDVTIDSAGGGQPLRDTVAAIIAIAGGA